MILSEIEKDEIRGLHKKRSIIKEQPGTLHCQKCLQDNPSSAVQNCNCPTCPCHPSFDVLDLPCNDCYSLFWTYQLKIDNCDCVGCPCGPPATPIGTHDGVYNMDNVGPAAPRGTPGEPLQPAYKTGGGDKTNNIR